MTRRILDTVVIALAVLIQIAWLAILGWVGWVVLR